MPLKYQRLPIRWPEPDYLQGWAYTWPGLGAVCDCEDDAEWQFLDCLFPFYHLNTAMPLRGSSEVYIESAMPPKSNRTSTQQHGRLRMWCLSPPASDTRRGTIAASAATFFSSRRHPSLAR